MRQCLSVLSSQILIFNAERVLTWNDPRASSRGLDSDVVLMMKCFNHRNVLVIALFKVKALQYHSVLDDGQLPQDSTKTKPNQ